MMFILIFLLGIALLAAISRDFTGRELLALGMPIGLGTTSFIMFLLDRTVHSITATNVTVSVFILAAVMGALRLYSDYKHNDLPWKRKLKKPDMSWLTLVWIVFAGMIGYLAYGITVKCMYWPPAEFDTILGYDLLSKAIAREHVIVNSILSSKDIVNGCGPRMLYPPLLSLCNALCYMTGMETPKLINALFFISWIFIIYFLLRRFVTSTGAILFTLLAVIVPEMYAHASFSLTNLPCAIYTTIAVMSFVIWYEQRREGFFYLSFLAIIFGIWTRSEAVLFSGGIMAVLLYVAIRERKFKYILIYALTVIPFLVWNVFLKTYVPRDQAGPFIDHFFFDTVKIARVMTNAWEIMSSTNIYGMTFAYIFGIGILLIIGLNAGLNLKNKLNYGVLGGLILWLILAFSLGDFRSDVAFLKDGKSVKGQIVLTQPGNPVTEISTSDGIRSIPTQDIAQLGKSVSIISILFLAVLALAATFINADRWSLVLIFFVGLIAYTAMFYQMKNDDGALFSSGGWMQSGYKRGLFCYAPLALLIIVTSRWISFAFARLDDKLALFKKPAA